MFHFKEQHVFYLVLMAGAGFFLSLSNAIPSGIGVSGDPGASFLPTTICILILALMVYLFIKEGIVADSDRVAKFKRAEVMVLVASLALIFVYVWFLETAGFISATIVFLFIFQRLTQFILTGPNAEPEIAVCFFSVCEHIDLCDLPCIFCPL